MPRRRVASELLTFSVNTNPRENDMPLLGGFNVRVICDGVALEEFSTMIDNRNPSAISCWVASETNKQFRIEYKWATEENCHFRFSLTCDGVPMRDSIVKPTSHSVVHDKARGQEGYYAMLFSEMTQTDSEEAAYREVSPRLGTITVKVWRVSIVGDLDKVSRERALLRHQLDTAPIHESKKKLGGHRVAFGEMLGPKHNNHLDVVKLDKRPLRTFTFFYRPRGMLRALGHLPASCPPTPINRKRRLSQRSIGEEQDEVISEEEEVVTAKMNALSQQLESLRSKRIKRIKNEGSPRIIPTELRENEVIDLTSD